MVTNRGAFITAILLAAIGGCGESTQVRSYPAGSQVYVNGVFVGLTPLEYEVPSDDIGSDFQVRVEHPGYQTAEGVLRKETCPGRVVGGIFSFGIALLFRSTTCFSAMQDFALKELPGAEGPDAANPTPSVETRLQRLERLHEQGIISADELQNYRDAILKE